MFFVCLHPGRPGCCSAVPPNKKWSLILVLSFPPSSPSQKRATPSLSGCNQCATTSVLQQASQTTTTSRHPQFPVGWYKVPTWSVLSRKSDPLFGISGPLRSRCPDPFHHPVRKTKTRTMPHIIIDICHNPNSPTSSQLPAPSYHHQPPAPWIVLSFVPQNIRNEPRISL